jgi:glycosyltransferase involved in cell wall biosynthesis
MTDPLISIVIPIHNTEEYLRSAVKSMFAQSFTDWEMICINDGSTDRSGQILDEMAELEPRLRVVHRENQGLVRSLNFGISLARAPLICRMDGDDISMPDRLERQVAFMRQHPQHVAVGGSILKIDGDSDPLGIDRPPREHSDIERALLARQTGMFHPTTLIRASALSAIGNYRLEHEWVEDHDLWLRLSQRGRLANLDDVVLCYRLHAKSICWQRAVTQRERMNRLLSEAYAVRDLPMPASLLLQTQSHRSAAGPGKWARMAAKGFAPRTALKHLRRLWREPAALNYRLRMTAETLARLMVTIPQLPLKRVPAVPTFQ